MTSDSRQTLGGRFPTFTSALGAARVVGGTAGPTGAFARDSLLVVYAAGLCLAHGTSLLIFPSYTPRMALLVAVGVPGLILLVHRVRGRDPAAIAAAALIAWIVLAGVVGGSARQALLGTIGRESSGMILALSLGVWAVGRASSRWVVRSLPGVVLLALGFNALIGMFQVLLQIESGPLALQFSRATGLTPNPVYFGALAAAGAALAAVAPMVGLRGRVVLAACFGLSTELSGSRVALAVALVVLLAVALRTPSSTSRRRAVALPLGYVLGVLLGTVLSATVGGRPSTSRIGDGGGGRWEAWGYASEAIAERPVLGWGLGRFRSAAQSRFSSDFVRTHATDDLRQAWFDPHNILLELAVGLGVLGVVLALTWVVLASRGSGGPLVAPVVVIASVVMFQPAGLAVLPLGMLLFGCAAAGVPRPETHSRVASSTLAALLIGVAMAGWLIVADLRLQRAVEQVDAERAESAASWYPPDAVVADLVAQLWFIERESNPAAGPKALEWSQRAIDAEPDRPYYRSQYATRLVLLGDDEAARIQLDTALELQPWHVRTWYVEYALADRAGDDERLADAASALCELGQALTECPESSDVRP